MSQHDQTGEDMPTTYQLAQLSVAVRGLLPHPDPSNALLHDDTLMDVTQIAMEFWNSSKEVISKQRVADQQLRELVAGIFRFTIEEWRARLADFQGNPALIKRAISQKKYAGAEVHKKLFKDKSLTPRQRKLLVAKLPDFCANNSLNCVSTGELHILRNCVNAGYYNGTAVRHLVEIRQEQIARSKRR
jgi:hypothetical protein